MSEGRTAATAAQRVGSGIGRVFRAWRVLERERRQAALAALGLFITLFLGHPHASGAPPGAAAARTACRAPAAGTDRGSTPHSPVRRAPRGAPAYHPAYHPACSEACGPACPPRAPGIPSPL